jgi:hypothetical protein
MSLFRDIEKRIDAGVKKLFASETAAVQGKELIEIQRAILDEIEDRSQLLPRARRRFPYNELIIRIAAPEADRRSAIELVFIEDDALRNAIDERLRDEQIEFAPDLTVRVEALEQPPADILARGFHINYAQHQAPQSGEKAAPTKKATRFTVLHGQAAQSVFDVTRTRIHLGRLSEVLDERRRPVRRNDIAFDESSEKPNSTISRAHAHIEYDPPTGEFRLFDDGSTYGTSVVQNGRLVNVPPAGGRGLRLESGDEIYLGQARVLFEIS